MRLILCLLGTRESEGVHHGYRALQWGELRDVCEWLTAPPWCTGKIGTYGGPQTVDWMSRLQPRPKPSGTIVPTSRGSLSHS